MGDDDSDSDEWETAALPDIPSIQKNASKNENDQVVDNKDDDDEEDGWASKLPPTPPSSSVATGDPMILVNMTLFTQKDNCWPEVHSRFDRNSVNDPATAKQLRKTIEADYDAYAKNIDYLSEGIVIPCGSSVWKEALSRLRDERSGHYFCPIFPPK